MGFSSAGDKMAGDLVQGKKKKRKDDKNKNKKKPNNFALLHRYLPAYATGIMTA